MAKQTPASTPCSRKLRGISDGVSEAAKKSAPSSSPRPQSDRQIARQPRGSVGRAGAPRRRRRPGRPTVESTAIPHVPRCFAAPQ